MQTNQPNALSPDFADEPRKPLFFTRLLAADERRLPVTILIALALTGWLAVMLRTFMNRDTWLFDFFFHRSFVQWVLISAFAIGFVHVLRRIPEWLREQRALKLLAEDGVVAGEQTLVERRWMQIDAARREGRGNMEHLAKTLADHDDAEIDAAYRTSTDIVQMLPLIGFFGTVFGLSNGLYQSFLATGGATTKDFAKAIAVAFDNTLLGLALTIILFSVQSVLRKREEGLLLELNLQAGALTESKPESGPQNDEAMVELTRVLFAHGTILGEHADELRATRELLVAPMQTLADVMKQEIVRGSSALLGELSKQSEASALRLLDAYSQQLETSSAALIKGIGEKLGEQNTSAADQAQARQQEFLVKLENSLTSSHAALQGAIASLEAATRESATTRDSHLAGAVSEAMASHLGGLKEEIRRPRVMRFVEEEDKP